MLFFYVGNIINIFHSCQSKKLKLTYIRALHPSYNSRSRMGWGWGAKINVWECFSCKCGCREREGEKARQGLKIECTSVGLCVRDKNGDKDKGRDSGGGATNGGKLSSALRASVSQSEPWSEISWFFTVSAAHYLGGEWGESGWRVGDWEEMGVGI